jgi:hypothetical protein
MIFFIVESPGGISPTGAPRTGMTLSGHMAPDIGRCRAAVIAVRTTSASVDRPAGRLPRLGVRELSKVPISGKPIRSKMP